MGDNLIMSFRQIFLLRINMDTMNSKLLLILLMVMSEDQPSCMKDLLTKRDSTFLKVTFVVFKSTRIPFLK